VTVGDEACAAVDCDPGCGFGGDGRGSTAGRARLGLAAQGEFGLLRSWSDAALTLVVLGLPQGLLHLQYS
jgi:hypothetical protein